MTQGLDRPSWAQVTDEKGPLTGSLGGGVAETYVVRTHHRTLRRFRVGNVDVELRVARVDIIRSTSVHRGVPSLELVDAASRAVALRLPLEDLAPFLGEFSLSHLRRALF